MSDPALRQVMAEFIADQERRWLDESIPALGGRTPRDAAQDPIGREQLAQLLGRLPGTGARRGRHDEPRPTPQGARPLTRPPGTAGQPLIQRTTLRPRPGHATGQNAALSAVFLSLTWLSPILLPLRHGPISLSTVADHSRIGVLRRRRQRRHAVARRARWPHPPTGAPRVHGRPARRPGGADRPQPVDRRRPARPGRGHRRSLSG